MVVPILKGISLYKNITYDKEKLEYKYQPKKTINLIYKFKWNII